MNLICSNGCGSSAFKGLAEVTVDDMGGYLSHGLVDGGFSCARCGGLALDVDELEGDERIDGYLGDGSQVVEALCPACESMVHMGPEWRCPNCGASHSPAYGR